MTVYKFNNEKAPDIVRKGEGKMDDVDLQRYMASIIGDAAQLIDNELAPLRVIASDYYAGEPFGNEEEGRSQVVITEVRDTVLGIKPALLRIFFGPERVVEFLPRTAKGVAVAKQATDAVQFFFTEDNDGFLQTNSVLDDGLIRKLGAFKWGWEDECKTAHVDEGLDLDGMFSLLAREDVEPTEPPTVVPGATEDEPPTYTVNYTVKHEGRVRVWALAEDEFLFSREARSIKDALFVGHRCYKTRGQLIEMGIDEEIIDEHGGRDANLDFNAEKVRRERNTSPNIGDDPDAGEANDDILYVEGYPHLDVDGDGVAELRQVCTIGPGYYPVHNEPADERPFSVFSPIPEAHTLVGLSVADLTMDLQSVKSSLTRSMLDSLALAIYPRTTFIEGLASVEDILNTEIGAPIRMKRDGAVQPLNHTFTGGEAMPILGYFDGVGESRTGKNKGAMSLDADALQSSTKQAVNAAVTSSQERTETMARIFAEQCLKPLFRGIYKLLVKHRPAKRLIKLRGEYVEIDVGAWDADMDVIVNVALGTSLPEQRKETLDWVASKQEGVIALAGPDNPMSGLGQLRETYARRLELDGYRDVSAFFKPIDPNFVPPPAPPPPPSPETVLANAQLEIERMRTEKELAIKQAELELKRQKQEFDEELAVTKASHDFVLRRYQIDAQFKASYTAQQEELEAGAERAAFDISLAARKQRHAENVAAHQAEQAAADRAHEQELQASAQAHEQDMAANQPAAPGAEA